MNDLPEFLRDAFPPLHHPPIDLIWRLVFALTMGVAVAIVYRLTHRGEAPATPSFVATLVLLSVIIAVVTQVVGESVGRAFTLVGALSIVRFRTVVDDTRDTAFVIFAVVVGMAAGLGNMVVALIGLGAVSMASLLMHFTYHYVSRSDAEWTLQLRVGTGAGSEARWEALFEKSCHQSQLQSTATARQGASIDLTYKLRLKRGVEPLSFINEINRIEGIQNVELKRG